MSPSKEHLGYSCRQTGVNHGTNAESNLWQRRFWEHWIRDDADFARHCDYIHYNPVQHGLCQRVMDWKYSSFHRYVAHGIYSVDWGMKEELMP